MHFSTLFSTGLLALASTSEAFRVQRIPEDHILWGREGKPTTLKRKAARNPTPPGGPGQIPTSSSSWKSSSSTHSSSSSTYSSSSSTHSSSSSIHSSSSSWKSSSSSTHTTSSSTLFHPTSIPFPPFGGPLPSFGGPGGPFPSLPISLPFGLPPFKPSSTVPSTLKVSSVSKISSASKASSTSKVSSSSWVSTKVSSSSKSSSASKTSSSSATASCTNGPTTRNCWSKGFNISTDYDTTWPDTGVTRQYHLEVTNSTCNPDGNGEKLCMLINGQYPGPTIVANWGDKLSITVKKSLQSNGTSFHWHGIRQLNTNDQDGVNGITECPIAPGDSKTYEFQATQHGTSWYHSHFSVQYGNGVIGTIQINGPATANYDLDLGTYTVNDWYYQTADQISAIAEANLQQASPPPPADTVLINGTNKNAAGAGSYGTVTLTPGKSHRLRIINTSIDNSIRVSLDGHSFQVISADFVPIQPYTTEWVLLGIGQRYDVIINATQTPGNYWFRANPAPDCAAANNFYGLSIFNYQGTTVADPTTSAATAPSVCQDESVTPWWNTTVPSSDFASQIEDLEFSLDVEQVSTNGQNIVVWGVNLTAIDIDWEDPTLEYVATGNTSYPSVYNLIELPTEGIWTYWIIQETGGANTPVPIPHPIHLHGHDFFILGTGAGIFDTSSDTAGLNFANPPRRDVTFLPGGGWVVIAFETDNPGAWLLHCHIAWHISEGLGVQFLESKSDIKLPDAAWHETCSKWDSYYNGDPAYLKLDSGL